MKKLIAFIILNHPEFADEIEGCTEEEIKTLESLIPNTTMPEAYKDFLRLMGKKTGRVIGLRRNGKGEPEDQSDSRMIIDIDYFSVLRFYKMAKKKNWQELGWSEEYGEDPSNYFLVGIDNLGNDNWHLFIDLRKTDLPVVEYSHTLNRRQHAPSFRTFLFDIPFSRTLKKFEHTKEWL